VLAAYPVISVETGNVPLDIGAIITGHAAAGFLDSGVQKPLSGAR